MHYKYDFYPNSQNFHKNFKNFMAFLLKDCSINKSTIKLTTQPKKNWNSPINTKHTPKLKPNIVLNVALYANAKYNEGKE